MKEIFNDILAMEDVRGVVVSSFEGEILFTEPPLEIDKYLPLFIRALGGMREADLIFEKSRIYVRRTDTGYLVILLGLLCFRRHAEASRGHGSSLSERKGKREGPEIFVQEKQVSFLAGRFQKAPFKACNTSLTPAETAPAL